MTLDDLLQEGVIKLDVDTGCWLYIGTVTNLKGYATVTRGQTTFLLHRALWEDLRGPIPSGLQLDHLCRRRHCVRPGHLEPVTNQENTRRISARYRKTLERCPEGHRYSATGIPTPEGGMTCRACNAEDNDLGCNDRDPPPSFHAHLARDRAEDEAGHS